tara:strand:+ start:140 stop:499 length:360 start_codon:yes stop_codon:yes gene_type:complete
MKTEHKEYILELLLERLSFFDEMSEQEWIDRDDPNGQEMKLLSEVITSFSFSDSTKNFLTLYGDYKMLDKNFLQDVYDTLMKNTQHKVRDFTKYKNVYVNLEKGYIKIGKRKLILERDS